MELTGFDTLRIDTYLAFDDSPPALEDNVELPSEKAASISRMGAGEQSLPEFAQSLLRPVFRCMAAVSRPGAIAFVCTDWKAATHMLDASQGVFAELKNRIVWARTNAGWRLDVGLSVACLPKSDAGMPRLEDLHQGAPDPCCLVFRIAIHGALQQQGIFVADRRREGSGIVGIDAQ